MLPKHNPSFITSSTQISEELIPLISRRVTAPASLSLKLELFIYLQEKEEEKKEDFWGD